MMSIKIYFEGKGTFTFRPTGNGTWISDVKINPDYDLLVGTGIITDQTAEKTTEQTVDFLRSTIVMMDACMTAIADMKGEGL